MATLVVTGAGGMLGQAVLEAGRRGSHRIIALTRAQLDVADGEAVGAALLAAMPDAVINCAAYTDVDGCETDEAAALVVNGTGPGVLARAATSVGAHLVHVSTDYVFDGAKPDPYVESDPVGPQSAYGRTKLAGEEAVAAASPSHAIVRTAWLFGVGGPNFVDTMLRLGAERDEVSVVTDQVGCPTWTGHLAPALIEIAERRTAGVQHVAGGGACSWNELALETFDQAGVHCRVLPTTAASFPRPAPRPAFSVLGSERDDHLDLPRWQDGLRGHLAQRVLIGDNA